MRVRSRDHCSGLKHFAFRTFCNKTFNPSIVQRKHSVRELHLTNRRRHRTVKRGVSWAMQLPSRSINQAQKSAHDHKPSGITASHVAVIIRESVLILRLQTEPRQACDLFREAARSQGLEVCIAGIQVQVHLHILVTVAVLLEAVAAAAVQILKHSYHVAEVDIVGG
jgi:hypothetical protein